ncbi:MAG TPA: FkbM family methyltransferase [Pyrinomonadaceae bacterium]|nr:FkbM family methyltransferase [Pyrinomonadaceae bacterium]
MVSSSNHRDRKLIFDIGLHNGDDAAYYLALGNRVVGVEANPLLAAACTTRFSAEIEQGRMTVINSGLLEQPGSFTFYRNLQDDGWSSFQPEKGRKDGPWEEIVIPCVTTRQLIEDHGKPFFMKVDIEGADLQALASLTPDIAPAYVSLELSYDDPILEKLIELGYTAFKFVNGETYWPTPPIFEHQIGWRVLRKIGRVMPIVRRAIGKLPLRFRPNSEYDPPGKYSPDGYEFGAYSSGPFGEQAAGSWLNADAALRWFGRLKENYRVTGTEGALWWDVHARHISYTADVLTVSELYSTV